MLEYNIIRSLYYYASFCVDINIGDDRARCYRERIRFKFGMKHLEERIVIMANLS
jgi:hypothetical protein